MAVRRKGDPPIKGVPGSSLDDPVNATPMGRTNTVRKVGASSGNRTKLAFIEGSRNRSEGTTMKTRPNLTSPLNYNENKPSGLRPLKVNPRRGGKKR
jgi:hypothetical protein